MRTVRGLTVVTLSTVLAIALIGVLGTEVAPIAGLGGDTSLADHRQLRCRWRTYAPCHVHPASRRPPQRASQ